MAATKTTIRPFYLVVLALILGFWLCAPVEAQQNTPRQTSSSQVSPNGPSCSTNYQFDHFVFAVQWPLSFCYDKKNECNLNIARRKKWQIHGLWPNRARGRGRRDTANNGNQDRRGASQGDIQFCCGPSYNASALPPALYQELIDKWPTLHANGKHHGFWKHEWQKHGTCSRQLAKLKTQQAYFEAVLRLYNEFNLNRATTGQQQLLQSNRTYQLEQFHRAIEPLVGGRKVRLECSLAEGGSAAGANNRQTGRPGKRQAEDRKRAGGGNQNQNGARTSFFAEVHICLDKTLQAIDCQRPDDQQCKKRVYFP